MTVSAPAYATVWVLPPDKRKWRALEVFDLALGVALSPMSGYTLAQLIEHVEMSAAEWRGKVACCMGEGAVVTVMYYDTAPQEKYGAPPE